MQITLDPETRDYLRKLRKKERDKKRYIKISVILALDAGHSAQEVAAILGLDDATIYRYAAVYQNVGIEDYLKQNWVPYVGKLTEEQREAIRTEVSSRLYISARAVAAWIECTFGIHYHEKHVVKLLHSLGFRYKKTQVVPGKADAQAQEAHIAAFEQLMAEKNENTVVFFNDGACNGACNGAHPQFNTNPEYGWILQGEAFEVPSQTGCQRLNITGAVNAQSTVALWEKIEAIYPGKRMIHICDNAAYYRSKLIKEWLRAHPHVKVMYLPRCTRPYSPNLNPIERVWKLLKKEKINSIWYECFEDFKQGIMDFFNHSYLWAMELKSLVTLRFRIIGY
ncbi:IS630 family transposase [Rhodoflexus caldus]|uniref:IS630 family transposase n=1 Tax=Rhodoflexus caldus TaxID=2891236 RepID=UPI00202A630B|nr:IS630 family transposase [Rhodoflexus caldus]